jgi:hypothetical protein
MPRGPEPANGLIDRERIRGDAIEHAAGTGLSGILQIALDTEQPVPALPIVAALDAAQPACRALHKGFNRRSEFFGNSGGARVAGHAVSGVDAGIKTAPVVARYPCRSLLIDRRSRFCGGLSAETVIQADSEHMTANIAGYLPDRVGTSGMAAGSNLAEIKV